MSRAHALSCARFGESDAESKRLRQVLAHLDQFVAQGEQEKREVRDGEAREVEARG